MSVSLRVKPRVLRWARERASLDPAELARRVRLKEDRVQEWETTGQITLARLEQIARKTYVPVGFLFLPEPPDEPMPIPDFRTLGGAGVVRPSANLLDTIYQCQQRQNWYRDFLVAEGEEPLAFIGSASLQQDPATVAQAIRSTLGLTNQPQTTASWDEALALLIENVELARTLVMRNGVVGNNTHRRLDVGEFRGFALSDDYAPLVFINAADAKAAQMFTLVHEVAHLWLGESGVSDVNPHSAQASERYCNTIAAEVLVPREEFLRTWNSATDPREEAQRVARQFRVSSLVILIRALDVGALSHAQFDGVYSAEQSQFEPSAAGIGGNFYYTQGSRLGKRFPRAVITSAIEGRTTYKEAFQLLGFKKPTTFDRLARTLGVAP